MIVLTELNIQFYLCCVSHLFYSKFHSNTLNGIFKFFETKCQFLLEMLLTLIDITLKYIIWCQILLKIGSKQTKITIATYVHRKLKNKSLFKILTVPPILLHPHISPFNLSHPRTLLLLPRRHNEIPLCTSVPLPPCILTQLFLSLRKMH